MMDSLMNESSINITEKDHSTRHHLYNQTYSQNEPNYDDFRPILPENLR